MKFFFLNGTFKDNIPQGPAFKEILDAHHAYWAPYMKEGKVLIAGPKTTGAGILVLKCEENENVQDFIDADPFVTKGVAVFEAMEFKPFYVLPETEQWFVRK